MSSEAHISGTSVTEDSVKLSHVTPVSETATQFNLNHEKFASLGSAEDFNSLHDHLIGIDIAPILKQLGSEDYFEVHVPMVGMADFLTEDPAWTGMPQQFASVLALNGFGREDGQESSFPRPYFVLAKDIAGNEYEILVDHHGQVEIPHEGTGLFSMLTSLTYIYSADQVLNGAGFSDIKEAGAQDGMLYLLPPPGSSTSFTATVGISHLSETMQREVDVLHKVPLMFQEDNSLSFQVSTESLSHEMGALLHLQMVGSGASSPLKPSVLHLSLDANAQGYTVAKGGLPQDALSSHGWEQVNETTFEKHVGLSDYGMKALIRNVFSEFDFTKALFCGEHFGIEQTNGFNDFA